MLVVGERINSSRRGIEPAVRERNAELITKEAKDQVDAGAHVIDVNTAALMDEEVESLKWTVRQTFPYVSTAQIPLPLRRFSPSVKGRR